MEVATVAVAAAMLVRALREAVAKEAGMREASLAVVAQSVPGREEAATRAVAAKAVGRVEEARAAGETAGMAEGRLAHPRSSPLRTVACCRQMMICQSQA